MKLSFMLHFNGSCDKNYTLDILFLLVKSVKIPRFLFFFFFFLNQFWVYHLLMYLFLFPDLKSRADVECSLNMIEK